MHAFDMHIHTSRHSPDSAINPFSLLRQAERLGLTGVVITEHDWLWTEEELDELRAATPGVQVYAGVEVSAHEGHFLCYGLVDAGQVPKGIELKELCEIVHGQGGVVVAAHPYRWGQNFNEIVAQGIQLDGLEVMSSNMDTTLRERAKMIWQEHGKPWSAVGNSDAHVLATVGMCYSVFPERIRDLADLLEALRSGLVEAHEPLPRVEVNMVEE
jgi:predicted metal-dependent phosphoesterase TrpH